MKIVSYNIRFGLGLDQCVDLGRIADTVMSVVGGRTDIAVVTSKVRS